MKAFITGANGYIGKALVKVGCEALPANVCDYDDIGKAIEKAKPELVIHLAGKSAPDWCETHLEESFQINFRGTYFVARNCAERDVPIVLLSSSQIWGGGWWESLWNKHSENSRFTPAVNSYGMQKVAAEAAVTSANFGTYQKAKIIRTSFVFNRERFKTELEWLKHGVPVDSPKFLKRSFIHLDDFVYLVSEYCKNFNKMPTVLHLAGNEQVSYYKFWLEVCKQFGYSTKLVKGRKKEFKESLYPAKRPHYGGLDTSLSERLGFRQFNYIEGIKRMKDES